MKVFVAGVNRMHGIGAKTQSPYDFSRLVILNKFEPFANETTKRLGHGFEPAEISARPELLDQLADVKFPAVLDIVTDTVFRNGRPETIAIGVNKSAS